MVDELEALYRERLPEFTRAATAIAGDEESGRDAVQDAFAKALRKRRRFPARATSKPGSGRSRSTPHATPGAGDMLPGWGGDASQPSYTILDGSVTGPETALDVTLTDGSTTTLSVVEHLFLAALPRGSKPASIVGHDANGSVVASWRESS